MVLEESGRIGSRGGHTYTETHRRSYERRQEAACEHAKLYYAANQEAIKAKRMRRYYRQRDERLAASRAPAVVSHSGDDKNNEEQ